MYWCQVHIKNIVLIDVKMIPQIAITFLLLMRMFQIVNKSYSLRYSLIVYSVLLINVLDMLMNTFRIFLKQKSFIKPLTKNRSNLI